MKIVDVSFPLNSSTPLFPGTTPLQIIPKQSPVSGSLLSEITMSSHAGTHVDAPSHALQNGAAIDSLDLEIFYGLCRVLDLRAVSGGIDVLDIKAKNIKPGERILLKTSNSDRGFDTFFEDYIYLTAEGAQFLADCGVKLVGIDSLSIKRMGLPDNRAHTELLSKNIPVIEGLNLKDADEGEYMLIALPLAFTGIDGSPARAVLLKDV